MKPASSEMDACRTVGELRTSGGQILRSSSTVRRRATVARRAFERSMGGPFKADARLARRNRRERGAIRRRAGERARAYLTPTGAACRALRLSGGERVARRRRDGMQQATLSQWSVAAAPGEGFAAALAHALARDFR